MKKILGLDLGSNSIGWAFIVEAENENELTEIKKMGVRIIPMGKEKTEFEKGDNITKNADRRNKRSARRNNNRYKLRKRLLIKKLTELEMLPGKELLNISGAESQIKLYELRTKALREKITLTELGRILYHLNQKRGFKSNRKAQNKEESDTEYLNKISSLDKELAKNNSTVGEYIYNLLKDAPFEKVRGTVFRRERYIDEFNKIWNKQKGFYPEILTDDNLQEIRDKIIYYHRKLKSQKHLVSDCRYEKKHKAVPKSSPFNQLFKIYQQINNIRITHKNGTVLIPTEEERKLIFGYLEDTASMTAGSLIQLLKLKPKRDFTVNYEKLEGNATRVKIKKAFEKAEVNIKYLSFNPLSDKPDKEPLYQIWHMLYSVEDYKQLLSSIQKLYDIDEEKASIIAAVSFNADHANLSSRAIRKLLPKLMEGLMYSEACDTVGYKHSDNHFEERELLNRLEPVKSNELRNPVVEKVVNQTVNLINAILTNPEMGRPDEIRIELARELKSSIKERKNSVNKMKDNKKENDRAVKRLEEHGLRNITRNDIIKYRLWEECDHISPYTGKVIGCSELFGDDALYDIEHIIPKARIFDDSFSNKTLCENKLNRDKGIFTANDYMKSKSEVEYAAYIERINKYVQMDKRKKSKFFMSEKDIPDDFIDRQLRETQYISQKVKDLLRSISRRVVVTSGSVTDYLKHSWGIDEALKELNLDKYKEADRVETIITKDGKKKEIIKNWSKRDDHRNHAIDAAVVAFTKQSHINKLNRLNQFVKNQNELKEKGRKIEEPINGLVHKLTENTERILVSYKQDNKVLTPRTNKITTRDKKVIIQKTYVPRGALHKETIYGKNKEYEVREINTRFDYAESIVDPDIQRKVKERLTEFDNDPKKAFKAYSKNPIWIDEGKTIPLMNVTIANERFVIRKELSIDFSQASKIIDPVIKEKVEERLALFNHNPKEAFRDLDNNPIWLNKEKGRYIRKVRIYDDAKSLQPLHVNTKGEPIDFVALRNNHHIALYKDCNGNIKEEVVSFWEAVERKLNNKPVEIKNFGEGTEFITTMHINDLYVFGLNPNETDFFDEKNYGLISRNLYRVQKLSSGDYFFRHHLETTLEEETTLLRIRSAYKMSGIKIKVNTLGEIIKVGE